VLLAIAPFIDGPEGIPAKLFLSALFSSGLLLVSVALYHSTRRSYIWLCFVLLFYFTALVQALFAPGEAIQTGLEIVLLILTVCCFISAMLAARFYPA